MNYIGNKKLLDNKMASFLCSDACDEKTLNKIAAWADKFKDNDKVTILSGFQSSGERLVLEKILSGKANAVMLLARCMFLTCPEEYVKAVNEGRLLIVSVTDNKEDFKVDYNRAFERNLRVISGGEKIIVGFVKKGGMVEKVLEQAGKPYVLL